ncbi:hypothetical protein [Chondromyces crocatus]|uniref:Lipoprotein n=1 Tax=Chondromyces crocatus TaxID=52 RepID=A0A0K1EED7_CHOCO|nr:hypothetical protein [Chondromyces crocatus]AKT39231.1 uncharacterized protein CMC5_033800 [Chondromyces crocatus]
MIVSSARWAPLLALLVSACGSAAAPPSASPSDTTTPGAAPGAEAGGASAGVDPGAASKAASAALTSLERRNFDTEGCVASKARVVPEAEARAGMPKGERCGMLVARKSDETWLVVVRSALSSKSYGAQALVTVASEGQGVRGIEYTK